ncbi:MAG TPA: GNAT family N-acetyltransferase [Candidatus Limnocylindria bacterium]
MTREPVLPIDTGRLRLRSLTETDAEALHRIYGDAETMRYVGRSGQPTSDLDATRHALAYLRDHEARHGFSLWAVDEPNGDDLVALCGLLLVEGTGPEIEAAYLVRRDRWRRGYATEALGAVLPLASGPLSLERVIALAWAENDPSRMVMERAGMRADGRVEAYGRLMTRHAWPA